MIAENEYTCEHMHQSFIVIEGPDGSGTTTHSTLLAETLRRRSLPVVLTREPSDGPIGRMIRTFLAGSDIPSDALQLLFTADRAWHVRQEICPALKDATIIVCEQYILSTLMFGKAAGLDENWLAHMNSTFPKPDVQLILLPPFEECVRRWSNRDTQEILEEESFQRKVYDLYRAYADVHHIPVIDSSKRKEEVAEEILSHVLVTLPFLQQS